jgi:hypothetical protein
MLQEDITGTWVCVEGRLATQTVTSMFFSKDGAYRKSVEKTINIPTPYGPVEETLETDTDYGTWEFLGPGELQIKSKKAGRSILRVQRRNRSLVINAQEFTNVDDCSV